MKKLKMASLLIVIALLTCSYSWGQQIRTQSVVTISGMNYGPGIGEVWGTYTYKILIKLSDEGYVESLHWSIVDCNLSNTDGDKVVVTGSGNDDLGTMWGFLNYPNASNAGFNISYDLVDGWMNDFIPAEMPSEGHFVMMGCKVQCKGTMYYVSSMVQVHINANGELTSYVVKSH